MKIEITDNKKMQFSFTIKMILLAFLGLVLLIPLEMVKSIIRERQKNSEEVKKSIALQWAGEQTISGPVLNIPVKVFPEKKDADPKLSVFHILPESLVIKGNIDTEKRHKGIYDAVVYTATLDFSGSFKIPDLAREGRYEILWDQAYYDMGISDNRGLKGSVILDMDSAKQEAVPGLKDTELFSSGISFPANLSSGKETINYSVNLKVSGSEGLNFIPIGKLTDVSVASKWNAPGFKGNFLPYERNISDAGFTSGWRVTNLNRNFPQVWQGNQFNPSNDSFGVDFVLPVDHYQKSLRSAKYGILFIALTFLVLIFAETGLKEEINVFRYLLIALALVLFFSLLNALSEYTGFTLAYLLASASTIILILMFLRRVMKRPSSIYLTAGILVALYAFIFVLLTLNDYAYLAGNIGLFILLAITMRLSSNLEIFNSRETVNRE